MAVDTPLEIAIEQCTENGRAKQDDRPGAGGRPSRRLQSARADRTLSDVGAVRRPSVELVGSCLYGRRYGYDPG